MTLPPQLPPQLPPAALDDANPYARAGTAAHAERNLIIAPPVVDLPHRCIFCNEPDAKRLTMKYSWHHPALYLLILAGILIYAIVALIIQKKATVRMSLCALHAARRQRKMLIFWLVPLIMIGVIIAGPVLENARMIGKDMSIPFILFGILGLIIALVVAGMSGRLLKPKFIDERMLKLAGAGRPFLDSLGAIPVAPPLPIAQPVY
jgi:hypothetical protein